jgi:hypothetical protein
MVPVLNSKAGKSASSNSSMVGIIDPSIILPVSDSKTSGVQEMCRSVVYNGHTHDDVANAFTFSGAWITSRNFLPLVIG